MSTMSGDGVWHPPTLTEAEKTALQVKQKQREQLSSAMGQYLLKGYRMLGSNCAICGNILLRAPRSECDFCISCEELKHEQSDSSGQQFPPQEDVEVPKTTESTSTNQATPATQQQQTLSRTEDVLMHKIQWATDELSQTASVDYSTQLCVLIQEAMKTLGTLRNE
ncbi:protein ZNRD2-like [Halichondria panicea]|uniref:protein ZNRD2-like n=1 Tax=Halichondria panicea TaxID=6063 RepID=UPI00312B3204